MIAMKERALLTVGLVAIVAAIYFGYMVYQRRLVVYNGGGSETAAPDTSNAASTDAGA